MIQKEIILPKMVRGCHLITNIVESEILKEDSDASGLLHIFLKHTSAAITINENADPSVRSDLIQFLRRIAPENEAYYTHTDEGPDDMPSHIKSALLGNQLTIPVTHGRLKTGIWQGIYFCEFRNNPGKRKLILTLIT